MINLRKLILLLFVAACVGFADARTYLVAAGIEDYTGFPQKVDNLPNTCKDAKGIKDVYDKNKATTSLLLNRQASKAGILSAVRNVLGQAGPDDIVVFFFSGHGLKGGICAYDGLLFYDDLIAELAKSRSKNKMMFIHSCHSGSIRSTEAARGDSSEKSVQGANVMLFMSSRGNEYSWTNTFKEYSYFTDYLQRALKGKADVNRDRTITAKELFNYVTEGVKKSTQNKQHPVMWGNFSDDMPVITW